MIAIKSKETSSQLELMMMCSLAVVHDTLDPYTIFINYVNVAHRVINSSNICSYSSCLLSLHVNTFHGMFVVR